MTTTKYIVHGINCLNGKLSQQTYKSLESARKSAKEWKKNYAEFAAEYPESLQAIDEAFYIEKQVIISERVEF